MGSVGDMLPTALTQRQHDVRPPRAGRLPRGRAVTGYITD